MSSMRHGLCLHFLSLQLYEEKLPSVNANLTMLIKFQCVFIFIYKKRCGRAMAVLQQQDNPCPPPASVPMVYHRNATIHITAYTTCKKYFTILPGKIAPGEQKAASTPRELTWIKE